jgi:hypothetical protein
MKRARYALALVTLAAAAAIAAPFPAVGAWDGRAFIEVQHKGWGGGGGGGDRNAQRGGGGDRGREARPERREERRDRMTEDDRRSLHRDLDKANRELYGRRFQK